MENPMKILVVDDESCVRKSMQRILKLLGHSVVLAENGLNALEKFTEQSFDLVITDLSMPVMRRSKDCVSSPGACRLSSAPAAGTMTFLIWRQNSRHSLLLRSHLIVSTWKLWSARPSSRLHPAKRQTNYRLLERCADQGAGRA